MCGIAELMSSSCSNDSSASILSGGTDSVLLVLLGRIDGLKVVIYVSPSFLFRFSMVMTPAAINSLIARET